MGIQVKQHKNLIRYIVFLVVFITLITVTGVMGIFLPLPNIPGRSADGDKHMVLLGEFQHHYYEKGEGPIVVLLPSLGRPASDFNELTATLAGAGYRTIAIDLDISREIARSAKGDLFQLADRVDGIVSRLGLHKGEKIFLIGHAFGNRLARSYATKYTAKVKAVVLLAAGGKVPIAPDIRYSLIACFDTSKTNVERLKALRHAFFAAESSIPFHWRIGWDRSLADIQIQATRSTPNSDWWEGGGVPHLVIQGDKDTIAPTEHTSDLLKKEYPDRIEVVVASPAGHALLPEQPEFIGNTVAEYLHKFK